MQRRPGAKKRTKRERMEALSRHERDSPLNSPPLEILGRRLHGVIAGEPSLPLRSRGKWTMDRDFVAPRGGDPKFKVVVHKVARNRAGWTMRRMFELANPARAVPPVSKFPKFGAE